MRKTVKSTPFSLNLNTLCEADRAFFPPGLGWPLVDEKERKKEKKTCFHPVPGSVCGGFNGSEMFS